MRSLTGVVGAMMVLSVLIPAVAAHARTLVFQPVPRVSEAPRLDGDLSDPAWDKAPPATTYYKYWDPYPGLGELRTEFRMVYDDRGIYLAILNYEENLDQLRTNITVRDDPRLWQDDCAEIYFDPAALGVGYTKFVVNSIGTQQDLRRLDAAVTLNDWSGYGWNVATGRTDEGWTIEAFFPWSDLGARAEAGDLWMFNHVRYAFTTGSFQGVTWSPGGAYNRPENFGYIYFTDDEAISPRRVIDLVADAIDPPWRLPMDEGIYVGGEDGAVRFFESQAWLDRARDAVRQMTAQAEEVADGLPADHRELRDELNDLAQQAERFEPSAGSSAEALDAARQLDEMAEAIEQIYWRGRLHRLLAQGGE